MPLISKRQRRPTGAGSGKPLGDRAICGDLTAVSATFVTAAPTETDGCVFPGELCWPIPVHGYTALTNAAIRDQLSRIEFDNLPPIRQKMPAAAAEDAPCVTIPFGGFLSINKLSRANAKSRIFWRTPTVDAPARVSCGFVVRTQAGERYLPV